MRCYCIKRPLHLKYQMKIQRKGCVLRIESRSYYMSVISKKLNLLSDSFKSVLYEYDERFLEGMKDNNLAGDDISKYRLWEWTQGVGLYGYWQLFQNTGDTQYLQLVEQYYSKRFAEGLPSKNINTCAPMLTLAYYCDYKHNDRYMQECLDWAEWIMNVLPKTKEGGFQHITSDTLNDQELWDDTLFMTVLFLAKVGVMTDNQAYLDEAKYQFMLHTKYLADRKTGLWFHGWTFNGNHNFVGALWGRGNAWITIAIPEFLDMVDVEPGIRKFLIATLNHQVRGLQEHQDNTGMWHTLIDDPDSYLEASATAGFGYGIMKACRLGVLDQSYMTLALNALQPIMDRVDENGVVQDVSYGTAMGRATKQFYKDIPIEPMPYGQAMTMLFLIEAEKLPEKVLNYG